jgi:hypothetical protein
MAIKWKLYVYDDKIIELIFLMGAFVNKRWAVV